MPDIRILHSLDRMVAGSFLNDVYQMITASTRQVMIPINSNILVVISFLAAVLTIAGCSTFFSSAIIFTGCVCTNEETYDIIVCFYFVLKRLCFADDTNMQHKYAFCQIFADP